MQQNLRERLIGSLGSAIVVSLLGYLLFVGLSVEFHVRDDPPMMLVDLQPPPPQRPPKPRVERRVRPRASGRASPRNLRNKATEIVAPPPPVLPVIPPPPVMVAAKPGTGSAASSGASDRPGPGEGAGGQGNGSGGGGNGAGDGDEVPPRLIRGRLKFSDLPSDLRAAGVGGTVGVRYQVEVDGRVAGCTIMTSSGIAELDTATCRLIEQRFRFNPSLDGDGRPVRSIIEESHSWIIERPEDSQHPA